MDEKNRYVPSLWLYTNYITGAFVANFMIVIFVWSIVSVRVERYMNLTPGTLLQYIFWIASAWGLFRASIAWRRFAKARMIEWDSEAIFRLRAGMGPVVLGNIIVILSIAVLIYGHIEMAGGMSGVPLAFALLPAMVCYSALFYTARVVNRHSSDIAA